MALGVLGFFAALIALYFLVIDQAEQQAKPPAADEKLEDTRALAEKAALARRAIKPQEVAVENPQFGPGIEQYRSADGQLKDRRDLYSWIFAGAVKNLNAEYAVRDVVFRMRLFSCPDFMNGEIELMGLHLPLI